MQFHVLDVVSKVEPHGPALPVRPRGTVLRMLGADAYLVEFPRADGDGLDYERLHESTISLVWRPSSQALGGVARLLRRAAFTPSLPPLPATARGLVPAS